MVMLFVRTQTYAELLNVHFESVMFLFKAVKANMCTNIDILNRFFFSFMITCAWQQGAVLAVWAAQAV